MKIPMGNNRKWVVLVICVVTMVALGATVLAMTLPDDEQMASLPGEPFVSTGPNTGATEPAVPVEPSLPSVPPNSVSSGATALPGVNLVPDPPVLELNTLKRKDFTKVNGYITCKTEEAWLGVDVSVWQEDIDWQKVAASGIKFAMIRIAYRGWGKDARLQLDPIAEKNLQGAIDAGIKVGVYIYSQAINVNEAIEEAQFVLAALDGRELEMPVVFDWEVPSNSGARTRNVKAKTIHACAMAFCAEIADAGYQPMVYFNQRQGQAKYNLEELRAAGIELWLAMYTKAMTYEYKVQMWQYTDNGRVPGIDGRVDIDLYFPYF